MPFIRGALRIRTPYDSGAWLGFVGSAFVSKVSTGDKSGDRDDDVSIINVVDVPLKWLVSNRQSSSSESDTLPPVWGSMGHWREEW